MAMSLGDVAIWQPGRTEPGTKRRRSSLKDTSGCGGTFVLADLLLRNGTSALPISAGRGLETPAADQPTKLCLSLKS